MYYCNANLAPVPITSFIFWSGRRPHKLAFESRPRAPDVPALLAELVCDPCQHCSCQHKGTPATGLLSANDFSIVLGSEANCQMKHSPLKIMHVLVWFYSGKNAGTFSAFPGTNLEPRESMSIPQSFLKSLDRKSLWLACYRDTNICTLIKEALPQIGILHFINGTKLWSRAK